MDDSFDRDETLTRLDLAIGELLADAGVEAPPVDAIALAQRHLGMVVCVDRRQGGRGRLQRAGGQPHIYLRPEESVERHQWTVAHEIGEHLKASLLARVGVGPDDALPMTGEALANLFATRLLTPTEWFAGDAAQADYDLLELKARYATASHELLALRLLDLPEPVIVTIVDNDHVSRRRSNAWRVNKKLEPVELQCQRYVNYYSRPQVLRDNGWTVQCWPVHRSDWKREILRSVVEIDS